jgi:hypothetical protein
MPRPKKTDGSSDETSEDNCVVSIMVLVLLITGLLIWLLLKFVFIGGTIVILGIFTILIFVAYYDYWDSAYFFIMGSILLLISIGTIIFVFLPVWHSFPSEITWDALNAVWPINRIKIATLITGSGLGLIGFIKIVMGLVID